MRSHEEILAFWFGELTIEQCFKATPELDDVIRSRFSETHLALAKGVGDEWRVSPETRLAAIIVIDQFPRNIYRGTAHAFATDGLALREARLAMAAGADSALAPTQRMFLYMPFQHSESLADQDRSAALFSDLGIDEATSYAERHRTVIREFGRFPHRNVALGRESTPAELEYLAMPGAGF
ncbi:DUF924 domain-containing protein [Rhizobiaceae bacterium n13]|uniref:DUF924 domain-containing protein n=2 Tax=Ferirhizobium litorale TaxID=2927786 RepID=A0AAE3U4I5_9HYPH|nr:DUF924 family protein [Fererhizobium litorale]MDI7863621.1 DUF924 domain-containing protein [Fererhizobium litorale]MDI7923458.1 DUF924 domain-containing protein [Fererhizobium litorale]